MFVTNKQWYVHAVQASVDPNVDLNVDRKKKVHRETRERVVAKKNQTLSKILVVLLAN